jgi:cyanophycinase-like exopeptidase
MARNLVLLGSGETSPTMVTPHQQIFRELPDNGRGSSVYLDTSFGFQENADEISERIENYFLNSVGTKVTRARLQSSDDSAASIGEALAAVRAASWVFAGPGSPTYALDVWQQTGMAAALEDVLSRGVIIFASAAALTAGTHTVPVYEIYKVGEQPSWRRGMDLLSKVTGLKAAVIPHFDNAEGGTHDTRFCYMGERRLSLLEEQLPSDTFILGIDEHTGVRIDLDEQRAHVFGRGGLTVRMGGRIWTVPAGETVSVADIAAHSGTRLANVNVESAEGVNARHLEEMLESGRVNDAVEALLNLDEIDRDIDTRAVVHALITRLGQIAASPRVDVRSIVGPYIDALLEARQIARNNKRWDEADIIRDRLTELKVVIKDDSAESSWEIELT